MGVLFPPEFKVDLPLDTNIGRHSSTPHLEGEPAISSGHGQSTSFTHHASIHREVVDQYSGLSKTEINQGIYNFNIKSITLMLHY